MNPEKPEIGMILTCMPSIALSPFSLRSGCAETTHYLDPPTYTQPPIDHVPEHVLAFKPSLFDSGGEVKLVPHGTQRKWQHLGVTAHRLDPEDATRLQLRTL